MQKHFDMREEEFLGVTKLGQSDADGNSPILFITDDATTEIANVTFTLRVGSLTPMAARELYESLDGAPQTFHEILAQYYFDVFGEDINDPLTHSANS